MTDGLFVNGQQRQREVVVESQAVDKVGFRRTFEGCLEDSTNGGLVGTFLRAEQQTSAHVSAAPRPSLTPRRNSAAVTGALPARCTCRRRSAPAPVGDQALIVEQGSGCAAAFLHARPQNLHPFGASTEIGEEIGGRKRR